MGVIETREYSINTVKLSYQKIILEKIFNNIFEILNLHLYNFARLSLVNLLEYTKNHQSNLLNKLKLPTQFENDKILFLGNDALNQLDIFHKNGLFNIINYTKTIIGKRFLENNLKKPLINKLDIEETSAQIFDNETTNAFIKSILALLAFSVTAGGVTAATSGMFSMGGKKYTRRKKVVKRQYNTKRDRKLNLKGKKYVTRKLRRKKRVRKNKDKKE
jgi:hypothetical protein